MKKIFLLTVLTLSCAGAFAQSGKSIYMKYSEKPLVNSVYISPSMFSMMGQLPDMEMDDETVNLTAAVKSLSGLYIIESENKGVNNDIARDLAKMVQSSEYERLMESKDDGEVMRIYIVADGDYVQSFVLYSLDEEECDFICIEGNMLKTQMMSLIGETVSQD